DELRAERDELWQQKEPLEKALNDLRARFGEHPEALLARLREKDDVIKRLREDLATRPSAEAANELDTLRADLAQRAREQERLTRELTRLQAVERHWATAVAEKENAVRIRDVAEKHADAMK